MNSVYSGCDTVLAPKVKELLEIASKKMRTINHEDVSCTLVKCNPYK